MVFANPLYLFLLLLLIPVIVWYILKQKNAQASLQVSTTQAFDKMPKSYKVYLRHVRFALRLLVITCLIIVLARPQSTDNWQNSSTEGVDIVLALDISGSMMARDFKPDRVEAAKDVAAQFVSGRENDNIGLVIFAGESFTMCPMTTDHAVLLNLMKDVHCGMVDDGTAIGDGLATAINRIKDGPAKSKTIILLTDGTNNAGDIAPLTAAQIAKSLGIRVYTIGVGSKGLAPYPVQTPYGITYQNMPVEIDESALQQIAATADGKYFRATNKNVLKNIFEEIDKMEKTKLTVKEYSRKEEDFMPWAILALVLLGMEIVLRNTLLRNIP
ncbi:VWA domain-containing protein [Barnesiella propionica]|uniref:vWA domain-containing protein n=1 Tax=Barnesiella propionica TaxID=2981781 RepID=UPI0011C96912|nr:VWA domain-containing protein [Barnesiella propionica]MCU6768195.1 VWA domain-containing protein [Barnesiella propionica]